MIRSIRLRSSGLSRASHALQAQPGKGEAPCSTVPPHPQAPSKSADKPADKTPAPAAIPPAAGARHVVAPRRSEWRPSEAHKTSATSVARKEARSAQLKAGVAPRPPARAAATGGEGRARSPGLRRRELLGGAEDVQQSQVQAQLAAASATPSPETTATAKAAVAAAAGGEGSAPSVVSLSATSRFRARRELERLAAAGNAEAIEALRVSGSLSAPSSPAKPGAEGGGADGGGADGPEQGSGGFTPLTVLPVLLALVGAGYCVLNDLVPREWLWRLGGGGNGGGAGPADSALAEGRSSSRTQEDEDASSLSPLLRTLSRMAAFVPVASSSSGTSTHSSADPTAPAPLDSPTHDGGEVPVCAASGLSSLVAAGGEGQEDGGGWARWSWWRHEGERQVLVDGKKDPVTAVLAKPPNVGEVNGAAGASAGAGKDDAGEQRQQQRQRQPRWLRRAG